MDMTDLERKELASLRVLAAGGCTIQKVIDELGPMSLWSKAGLDDHVAKKIAEALAASPVPMASKQIPRVIIDLGDNDEREKIIRHVAWEGGALHVCVSVRGPVPMASSAGEPVAETWWLKELQEFWETSESELTAAVKMAINYVRATPPTASLREQEDEKALRDGIERQEMLASLLKVLKEDAARLDWLDEKNKRFRMGWKVGMAPAGNVSVQSVIFAAKAMTPTPIREAIDAQRLGRGKENGNG
jgi:hypothetical protein